MLLGYALALLAGAATIRMWAELPGLWGIASGVGLMLLCLRPRWSRPLAAFLLGALLAVVAAHHRSPETPAGAALDQPIIVHGTVADLPADRASGTRLRLAVDRAFDEHGRALEVPATVLLTWPGRTSVVAGERWRIPVRLREPKSTANPGGFDFQRWLFREGIGATGYVHAPERAQRLASAGLSLDRARARLRAEIVQGEFEHAGIMTALAVGDRSAIDDATWDTLLATGTNHLIAISGLHIGLAAGAGLLLGRMAWRLLPAACQVRWPRPLFAAGLGLICAGCYAGLAGFAVPTQRALAMLAAGLGLFLLRRRARADHVLAIALLAVLALDPLATLEAGFWLSFGAVVAIFALLGGRLGVQPRWRQLGRLQFGITIALLPALLGLFGQLSLVSPLANLIAVPWVSAVVVPLTLLGTAWSVLAPVGGDALLTLADTALMPLLHGLATAARAPGAELQASTARGAWPVLLALLGAGLLLVPRGVPGKAAGGVCLLPLLVAEPPRPAPGDVWLDILDTDDGMSVVVRTHSSVLIHDTGQSSANGTDIVALLQSTGVERIDDLIISQDSGGHPGATDALRNTYPVDRIRTAHAGVAARPAVRSPRCAAGTEWHRDGVAFRVVHPDPRDWHRLDGAAGACVVRIDAPGGSVVLVPGLDNRGEWFALTRATELAGDVLVTSGDGPELPEFLATVDPDWVIHTGHGHGHNASAAAHADRGYRRTECVGRVQLRVAGSEGARKPRGWLEQQPRFWHRKCRDG